MIRKIYIFLAALLAAISASAVPRSVADARSIALQFRNQSSSIHKLASSDMQLRHTIAQPDGAAAAYVFQATGSGYVIVSADDQARAILGYSDEGTFDPDNIPSNMQFWLNEYAREIATLEGKTAQQEPASPFNLPFPAASTTQTTFSNLSGHIETTVDPLMAHAPARKAAQTTAITPWLGNIMWDQDTPYNNLCPTDPQNTSVKCYTGCVATAGAQIMRYHQWPKTGTGSHSYTWEHQTQGEQGTLSADFNTTYDWDNMLEKYSDTTYTDAQAQAVAKLMYHVGVASNMSYGGAQVGGSGAISARMGKTLYTYFGYDKAMRVYMPDYVGQAAFEARIAQEPQYRPFVLSGATSSGSGHCFVCDGMDADGYYHINWGWSGISNGYFAIGALDPRQQGAGGSTSGSGYNHRVEAIVNILPNQNAGDTIDQIGLMDLYIDTTSITVGSTFTLHFDTIANIGVTDWSGSMAFYLCDTAGTSSSLMSPNVLTDVSLPTGYGYYGKYSNDFTFPQVSDGMYEIVLAYTSGSKIYLASCVKHLYCTVKNGKVTFQHYNPDGSNIFHMTCAEAREAALALPSGTIGKDFVVVTGYVTSTDGTVSRGQQCFYMDDTPGTALTFYSYWGNLPTGDTVYVGDKVILTGHLQNYSGTAEIKNGNITILRHDTIYCNLGRAKMYDYSETDGDYYFTAYNNNCDYQAAVDIYTTNPIGNYTTQDFYTKYTKLYDANNAQIAIEYPICAQITAGTEDTIYNIHYQLMAADSTIYDLTMKVYTPRATDTITIQVPYAKAQDYTSGSGIFAVNGYNPSGNYYFQAAFEADSITGTYTNYQTYGDSYNYILHFVGIDTTHARFDQNYTYHAQMEGYDLIGTFEGLGKDWHYYRINFRVRNFQAPAGTPEVVDTMRLEVQDAMLTDLTPRYNLFQVRGYSEDNVYYATVCLVGSSIAGNYTQTDNYTSLGDYTNIERLTADSAVHFAGQFTYQATLTADSVLDAVLEGLATDGKYYHIHFVYHNSAIDTIVVNAPDVEVLDYTSDGYFAVRGYDETKNYYFQAAFIGNSLTGTYTETDSLGADYTYAYKAVGTQFFTIDFRDFHHVYNAQWSGADLVGTFKFLSKDSHYYIFNFTVKGINPNPNPTGLEDIDAEGERKDQGTRKVIENGRLYILRDGQKYDAAGQIVK